MLTGIRSAGFPPEGSGILYNNGNHAAIVNSVNTVWDVGIRSLFPALPELLAVRPFIYLSFMSITSLYPFQPDNGGLYDSIFDVRVVRRARALFIWKELSAYPSDDPNSPQYLVSFYIETSAPFCASDLAYALLRFTDDATRTYVINDYNFDPYHLPTLRRLTYFLSPSGVYGTAFFDGLQHVYQNTHAIASVDPSLRFYPDHGTYFPLTTWPEREPSLLTREIVGDCWSTTRFVNPPR